MFVECAEETHSFIDKRNIFDTNVKHFEMVEGSVIDTLGHVNECRAYQNGWYYGWASSDIPCKVGDSFIYSGVAFQTAYYAIYDSHGNVLEVNFNNTTNKVDGNGIAIPVKKRLKIAHPNASFVRFCTIDVNRDNLKEINSIYDYYVYSTIDSMSIPQDQQKVKREFVVDAMGGGFLDYLGRFGWNLRDRLLL